MNKIIFKTDDTFNPVFIKPNIGVQVYVGIKEQLTIKFMSIGLKGKVGVYPWIANE